MKGVNLGGWLVLEKWITPSLFKDTKAIDEYTYCEHAGAKERARLKQFRDTFITKQDFEWLAAQGVEAVRLPVGYWLFGGEPPFQPTVKYVDRVFAWAEATGIKVLLDLHGARGSQNGDDHSGRSGRADWHRDPEHVTHTLLIIQQLAERYAGHPSLLGIALLNEPRFYLPKDVLLDFYERAYEVVRKACGNDTWIVYSDAYWPSRWCKVLPKRDYQSLFMDYHHYQIFSPIDKLMPGWLHLLKTRMWLPLKLAWYKRSHPLMIGEWSLTLGGPGKRTPKLAKRYARAQLRAYRHADAWFFWTYQTEARDTWSFRDCVEKGLMVYHSGDD